MQPAKHIKKAPWVRHQTWLNSLIVAALTTVLMILVTSIVKAQSVISLDINGSNNPSTTSFVEDGLKEAGLVSYGAAELVSAATLSAMAPGTETFSRRVDLFLTHKGTVNSDKLSRAEQLCSVSAASKPYLSASEAYRLIRIDRITKSDQDLITQLDGKKVELVHGLYVIDTQKAAIVKMEIGFSPHLKNWLRDPTTIYVILILGLMGLLFELFSPGAIFPGIIGGICLCIAFYSFNYLPVNYIGLCLIIVGIVFYFLELKITSYGILAICGTLCLLLGAHLLFEAKPAANLLPLNWAVVIMVTVVAWLFFMFLIYKGLKAQRLKPMTGGNALVGLDAVALSSLDPKGQVQVLGEIWSAISVGPPIEKDQKVIIKKVKELTLYVAPL